jgi:hypothetical protein
MRWRFRPGHGGGLDQCCDPYLLGFILDKPFSADPGICRDLSYPQEYLSFRTFVSSRLPSFPFTFSPPSCPQRISDLLPVAAIMAPALLPLACLEAPMPHRLLLLIGCCCRRGRERFRMPMSHPQGRNTAESDRVAYWTGFFRGFPAIRGPARSPRAGHIHDRRAASIPIQIIILPQLGSLRFHDRSRKKAISL